MTRLKVSDIKDIASELNRYDNELVQKTGRTLRGIACHALDMEEGSSLSVINSTTLAVVPIQSGQGIIRGFPGTVKEILGHIGFNAFVTGHTDVAGIAEAVEKNASVILMADDQRFVALNIKSGHMSDNAEATAKGFIAGLDLMVGGLAGQKVFVIGCGPVGSYSVLAALHRGAELSVFDIRTEQSRFLAGHVKALTNRAITIEKSLEHGLHNHRLLVDAGSAAGIIDETVVTPGTYIAAPGMPLGLTPEALQKVSGRLLHDPLQLGTAVMALGEIFAADKGR